MLNINEVKTSFVSIKTNTNCFQLFICYKAFIAGMMWSVAQLLILFDHALLALLFLIAIFCVITAVSTGLFTSSKSNSKYNRTSNGIDLEVTSDEEEIIERTDTCYSVRRGTSVLYESDLNNVV